MDGVLLSVIAAFLLGGYLVAVKQYFNHYPPTLFVWLTYAAGTIWYLPAVAIAGPVARLIPNVGAIGGEILIATGVCTALALLSFYRALALGDVSYVAPISKVIPVFVLPLEVVLLEQHLSTLQIVGVGIATAAVYLANYRSGSALAPFRRVVESKAALLALASAAAFGFVDIGKRTSMQELDIPPEGFVLTMLVLVSVLLAPSALSRRKAVDWWADRRLLAFAGLVLVIGQHIIAMAFETLPASVVSPIVNTQAVIAVVLGGFLLGESRIRIRLAAAGLAVFGIALISLG